MLTMIPGSSCQGGCVSILFCRSVLLYVTPIPSESLWAQVVALAFESFLLSSFFVWATCRGCDDDHLPPAALLHGVR